MPQMVALFWSCIAFIHLYSASHSMGLSEALPTTAFDTASKFSLHADALHAAQSPYVADRAGFEPMVTPIILYCIVSIYLYSASCSAHQSEALPVRETQREEIYGGPGL